MISKPMFLMKSFLFRILNSSSLWSSDVIYWRTLKPLFLVDRSVHTCVRDGNCVIFEWQQHLRNNSHNNPRPLTITTTALLLKSRSTKENFDKDYYKDRQNWSIMIFIYKYDKLFKQKFMTSRVFLKVRFVTIIWA